MIEEAVLRDIESFILKQISKTKIPSVSVAIVDRDGEVWSRAFGFKDLEKGLPAKTTTLYGVGSVTKSFTCLSVMLLQEEGKLSIDDPVEKHLPLELRVKGESDRIWHLMTHSSGIPALAYAEALIRGVVGEENSWISISDCDDMYAFLRKAGEWGEFRPGEKHFYLNEGYVLLGCIVERVSGKSFVDFVHERVFQPLGMSRSYFRREDVESDGDYAVPYVIPVGGKPQPSSYPWGIAADGGLISNVHDLGRYLRMYLNGGVLDGREVVPRRVVEEMVKPRIPVSGRIFGDEKYGFGWFITERFHGEKLVSHGGSVLVYTAWVGFLPDRGLGVVLLANASGYSLSYLGMYALSLLIGEDPYKLPFLRLERIYERLAGRYTTYMNTMSANVVSRNGILYLEYGGKYSRKKVPLFFEREEGDRIYFSTIAGGSKMEVEFRVEEKRIVLFYERYKLVKE